MPVYESRKLGSWVWVCPKCGTSMGPFPTEYEAQESLDRHECGDIH